MENFNPKISVIGLGYVGLPVAINMSKKFETVGFDLSAKRVTELKNGFDRTNEVETSDLQSASVSFTDQISDLESCNFHIVAVPTPINSANAPDLRALLGASETVGKVLSPGDIVAFESTVYPGATEEECLPVLEKFSGLIAGKDFKICYSPERINPGDKEHTFTKITKVVSAQDEDSLEKAAFVYGSVVTAGVFKAKSIRVAEAAKVIENTQRDVNIALMNELAVICSKMNISCFDVLEAARTKWNFLDFTPGLVGGHCIGVDPYYLTFKAQTLGYHPDVILSGRRINDNMGHFFTQNIIKTLIANDIPIKGQNINIFGLTFKENCPDLRNTKVIDVVNELREYGMTVNVTDAFACKEEALQEYGINLLEFEELPPADVAIFAVPHRQYREILIEQLNVKILFDFKNLFSQQKSESVKIYRV